MGLSLWYLADIATLTIFIRIAQHLRIDPSLFANEPTVDKKILAKFISRVDVPSSTSKEEIGFSFGTDEEC